MGIESLLNVETNRIAPWVSCSTSISTAKTIDEALEMSSLNWKIKQSDIFDSNGRKIEGFKANMRDDNNQVLGLVTNKYQIIDNRSAFEFTEALLSHNDIRYEIAGMSGNGKRIWVQMRMPETYVLNDKFERFLTFTTSHDGSGSVKCAVVMNRIICANALSINLRNAKRVWSMRHTGSCKLEERLLEAQACLQLSDAYTKEFEEYAEILANTTISSDDLNEIVEEIFPIYPDMTERKKKNVEEMRDSFYVCMMAPDLKKFDNTMYQILQASADLTSHMNPQRMTQTFEANRWGKILDGHPLMNATTNALNKRLSIEV